MKSLASRVRIGLSIVLLATLAACKADPAPNSGFLEGGEKMAKNPDAPFNREYWNRDIDAKKYTEIYIAPVNTQYVMAQNMWERVNEIQVKEQDVRKGITEMAQYMQDEFKRAAAEDPKKRYKVVDKAGPNTVVLEMAIVQLVPSKAALNAVGLVSWIPTAVKWLGKTVTEPQDEGKGVIAMEARLRDGGTGTVVGMFADREHPPTAIVDLKSVTWWAPCKAVINAWAAQYIEMANNPGKKVEDTKTFELLTW